MTWIGLIFALLAVTSAALGTVGFVGFALFGIGGIRAATLLVDHRNKLLVFTLAGALVGAAFLVAAPPPGWAYVLSWIAIGGAVVAWAAFLPMVPERRFRALVSPQLYTADDVELDPDTRIVGFRLPDGPVAVALNVAAWHHIIELADGDDWHVGTY